MNVQAIEQENRILKLEKIEYQKEINNLKQQNEQLLNEKTSYLEMNKLAEQQISYLRSLSSEMNEINENNEDLHIQISQYQGMIKRLNLKCVNLQKENKKYELLTAELNKEKENKDIAYNKNVSELQKQIDELQTEYETLHKETHLLSPFTMIDDEKPFNPYAASQTLSPKNVLSPDITVNQHHFRYSTMGTTANKPLDLKYNASSNSHLNSNTSKPPMIIDLQNNISTANTMITMSDNYSNRSAASTNDNDGIMDQLIRFGYNESEIIIAMNSVNDTKDINKIVEYIENNRQEKYEIVIQEKVDEIHKLKVINKDGEQKIAKLKRKITMLKIKMEQNENDGCKWIFGVC